MIGYLKGKVLSKDERSILLDVNGVGYEITLPQDFCASLSVGNEAEIWVHTHVKEDILALYGLETKNQRVLFSKILGISGIGPKTALDIISTPIETLKTAVNHSNAGILTTIPGIGKKTAERLLIDLKSVFEKFVPELEIGKGSSTSGNSGTNGLNIDIMGALENLGFRKNEIVHVLNNLPKDIDSEKEIMKYALKELNKAKMN